MLDMRSDMLARLAASCRRTPTAWRCRSQAVDGHRQLEMPPASLSQATYSLKTQPASCRRPPTASKRSRQAGEGLRQPRKAPGKLAKDTDSLDFRAASWRGTSTGRYGAGDGPCHVSSDRLTPEGPPCHASRRASDSTPPPRRSARGSIDPAGVRWYNRWRDAPRSLCVKPRPHIEAVCRQAGFSPPIICTPEELAPQEAT